ncbi:unnamed protein product [Caenorhabditis bovis]|uniref:C-type lectin domain-containing protein n=1 Tax=Caenorhabditis bovis TaxID=2654633 RepID=A0A8S1EKI4_9PELO|nr:unnamed protein product [Caenorhabditis bovis]CAB3398297.1 unnamed protein product [Caenorhabditis bovis]
MLQKVCILSVLIAAVSAIPWVNPNGQIRKLNWESKDLCTNQTWHAVYCLASRKHYTALLKDVDMSRGVTETVYPLKQYSFFVALRNAGTAVTCDTNTGKWMASSSKYDYVYMDKFECGFADFDGYKAKFRLQL